MKERGKIQRKYDSVFIYMYIYIKEVKEKKERKGWKKVFVAAK